MLIKVDKDEIYCLMASKASDISWGDDLEIPDELWERYEKAWDDWHTARNEIEEIYEKGKRAERIERSIAHGIKGTFH